jgi:His/Glu/Gln/Arg/opine family amino acid ABC transporter permease subunit
MFQDSLSWNDLLFMFRGAGLTLLLTFWAVLGGTALGLVLGVARESMPPLADFLLGSVLDIFRSVPLLIQLILASAFAPIIGIDWGPFTVACVVLAIYTSAYSTEVVRGSIKAVPRSTRRAARSLGMTWWQDLTAIVFPMALRVGLPSWINLVLGVMKDTSIVLWLGVIELLRSSQIIVTRTQEPLLVLFVAGLIYFLISFPLARLGALLERKGEAHG